MFIYKPSWNVNGKSNFQLQSHTGCTFIRLSRSALFSLLLIYGRFIFSNELTNYNVYRLVSSTFAYTYLFHLGLERWNPFPVIVTSTIVLVSVKGKIVKISLIIFIWMKRLESLQHHKLWGVQRESFLAPYFHFTLHNFHFTLDNKYLHSACI